MYGSVFKLQLFGDIFVFTSERNAIKVNYILSLNKF
jgi:hypothetical protein